jgi:hypothetical protein
MSFLRFLFQQLDTMSIKLIAIVFLVSANKLALSFWAKLPLLLVNTSLETS